jgi:hypothetical protein
MDDWTLPCSLNISGGQEFLLEVAMAEAQMTDDALVADTMNTRDNVTLHDEDSAQNHLTLEQLYPALGALPERHTEQLQALLEVASTNYLTTGADSEATR